MSYSTSVSAQRTVVVSSGGYAAKRSNMANEVTVHRMVSSSTTSAVLINIGYLKTFPGILKILQIILGCVICGIIGHYITWTRQADFLQPELLVLIIAATCLITTSLLVFSCLCSISTASIMPKTLFESMYHLVAAGLYISCFIYLMVFLTGNKRYVVEYEMKIAANVVLLHSTLSYLLVCSSINLLREVVARNEGYKIYERGYNSKIFSGAIGLVNAILYIISSIYSVRTFRRG
ncbi:uncharacterized protein LOC135200087 isoform X3 [Macrobrachium nipponense]|uniref:uncharacterized protein LOC135200087 isoform X3 n=1 Tax=Macrobrachium nipponense TaxID=159736 RepID=UPI0030C7AF5D